MRTKKLKKEVWLTEGMDGKRIKKIFETDSVSSIMKKIARWKSLKNTKTRYKVESYDRIMHNNATKRAIIDFGDWHWFLVVDSISAEDFDEMTSMEK